MYLKKNVSMFLLFMLVVMNLLTINVHAQDVNPKDLIKDGLEFTGTVEMMEKELMSKLKTRTTRSQRAMALPSVEGSIFMGDVASPLASRSIKNSNATYHATLGMTARNKQAVAYGSVTTSDGSLFLLDRLKILVTGNYSQGGHKSEEKIAVNTTDTTAIVTVDPSPFDTFYFKSASTIMFFEKKNFATWTPGLQVGDI